MALRSVCQVFAKNVQLVWPYLLIAHAKLAHTRCKNRTVYAEKINELPIFQNSTLKWQLPASELEPLKSNTLSHVNVTFFDNSMAITSTTTGSPSYYSILHSYATAFVDNDSAMVTYMNYASTFVVTSTLNPFGQQLPGNSDKSHRIEWSYKNICDSVSQLVPIASKWYIIIISAHKVQEICISSGDHKLVHYISSSTNTAPFYFCQSPIHFANFGTIQVRMNSSEEDAKINGILLVPACFAELWKAVHKDKFVTI